MTEFFAMGGYAPYVWSSYGLTVLVLGGLLLASLRSLRQSEKLLKAVEGSMAGRRRRRDKARTGNAAGSADDGTTTMILAGAAIMATADTGCAADGGAGADGGC